MYRVMLVDDEPYMINGLKNLISWNQYGLEIVAEASNGAEALSLCQIIKPDILLTDVKMPKLSGIELIHALKALELCPHVIILSGYSDFAYVREALRLGIDNYLLKPINEEELKQTLFGIIDVIESDFALQKKAQEDSSILRHNILNRWLTNTISATELNQRAPLLQINLFCEAYTVCLLRILNDESVPASVSILDFCSESINSPFVADIFYDFHGDIVFLFSGNKGDLTVAMLRSALESLINNINQLGINVFVSIGNFVFSYEDLYKSYLLASNLLEYTLTLGPNQIADRFSPSASTSDSTFSIDIHANHFENLLLTNNQEQVFEYIDSIYNLAFSEHLTSPNTIKKITIDFLYIIHKVARQRKCIPIYQETSIDELYSEIYKIHERQKLISIIKETCLQILTPKEDIVSQHPLIVQTIDYVDANLSKDISLKLLAAEFNMNPSYLGQLFKFETNEHFTAYLNRKRIQKAMQLLTDSKLNASEIAVRVGYTNTNYFYSCFKKYTGKYPTEYRREIWLTDMCST